MSALPRYRYFLAVLMFLIRIYAGFVMLVPVLYTADIAVEFGVSSTGVGNYIGFLMWACAAVVLFSGPIVTKFGAKRCCLIGTIFMALGVLATAFTPPNYFLACAFRFVLGLGIVLVTVAVMPITMTWFTSEEYGRVNGVLESSTSIGILLNFWFTPVWFPRPLWREAHLFYGIPAVILAILWAVFGRDPLVQFEEKEEKYFDLLKTRLHKLFGIKEVWLMGGTMWMAMGVSMAIISWIPSYLELEWKWPHATAALLASMYDLINIAGWPLGGTLSDKVGLRRPFFIVAGGMITMCAISAVTFVGPASWIWFGFMGLFTAVYGFGIITILMEHPEIDSELISTAISVTLLFGFLGGAIMPTVFGAILDLTGSLYFAMIIGAALYTLISIFGLLIRETGWKAAAEEK